VLPEPLATEVDALRRALGGDDAVERIPAHVTLVPPVNVRVDDLDAALGVLRRAAARTRPFPLALGPTATFLPANPVVHLAVAGDLDALGRLRDAVFVPPLERRLTWPFHPHVTLLETGDADHVASAAEVLHAYRAEWTVRRVHLLEERRRDDGVRAWRAIADAGLGAPAVVGRGGLELTIETAARPDPSVRAWLDAAWDASSRDRYGTAYVEDDPVVLVGRRDGEVVGVAEGRLRGDEAYLARLIVDPAVQGEGVGSHLLAAFTAHAAEAGCDRVTLRTQADGPAERFYRERGFDHLADLPEWRFGRAFVQLVRRW
jgi:2'-5' RNA ligase/RimJ/RimL family protein N-acetyltransferase